MCVVDRTVFFFFRCCFNEGFCALIRLFLPLSKIPFFFKLMLNFMCKWLHNVSNSRSCNLSFFTTLLPGGCFLLSVKKQQQQRGKKQDLNVKMRVSWSSLPQLYYLTLHHSVCLKRTLLKSTMKEDTCAFFSSHVYFFSC